MVKRGIVVATDGSIATVEEIKGGYCFECIDRGANKNCLNCSKRTRSDIEKHISANYVGAEIGDIVEYSKNIITNLFFSLIVFVLPILLTVVTYVILNAVTSNDPLSARIALAVLAFSMLVAAIYSYKVSKIRCEYKIISKV